MWAGLPEMSPYPPQSPGITTTTPGVSSALAASTADSSPQQGAMLPPLTDAVCWGGGAEMGPDLTALSGGLHWARFGFFGKFC